ncbi:MAG: pilus assembly protein TadG-related protein [Paludisphaera borealis]|uniref:TadG family pilus assembly protein n=1 Tax=Paludisphaera borealis TaxID=1387353 RepID=UPI00283F1935|nr:TadG family pilus assembly protein [Paludisphaera borealis]MDR3621804.1 pilus assembly protein TadG-related protein [Paludisphaera borealis]
MIRLNKRRGPSGGVAPLVAVSMVALTGMAALAVDVGRIAVAKVECQSAADVAAMTGARTLDGVMPQNLASATTNAKNAAGFYKVMGDPIASTEVTVQHGSYRYDRSKQQFSPSYSVQSNESYNLTKVTINKSCPTTFAQVLGYSAFKVAATAVAAHRPRDVAIVLDYSGSMNNESDLWNCESYLDNGQGSTSNPNNTSNNQETVYPKFGHYSNDKNYSNYTNYANLLSPAADASNPLSNDPRIGKSNVSISALGIPAMVNDFWSNNRGASSTASAFTAASDAALDSTNRAGGDKYLFKSGSTTVYAATVQDYTGSTTKNTAFETSGYATLGYIQGPRYWGKTFFVWPPDPRAAYDWRQLYFGTKDNTVLWDASGNWRSPSGYYTINYKAILAWIKATPNPFPSQLRSGNILYYNLIPTDVPASAYTHTQLNSAITDSNQRFWKEYIDYVVGSWRDPFNGVQTPGNPSMSYGPEYTFGTVKISSPPTGTTPAYMNYADNPKRPRHRLWFGPMTMVQFMSDTGILPGTAHDISMYSMKAGLGQALEDIQNNHPNDLVSMILFSRPLFNGGASGTGAFNLAQYSLTNNIQPMINALWVPPNSGTNDVRPWDANGSQTPRAFGDWCANTTSVYGFMLAYNQFSCSNTLQALDLSTAAGVGGEGRVGAQRLIVYETDGMANQGVTPANGFSTSSNYSSYYQIQPGQTLNSAGYTDANLFQTVQNICNTSSGAAVSAPGVLPYSPNQGRPGFGTPGKPVTIHCLAFGGIFESPSSVQTSSVALLQQVSGIGGTVFPSSASDSTNGFKWCIGTLQQRQSRLVNAFQNIMNLKPVPITLIQ